MMETGKVRLAGEFKALEDELMSFTTHGYVGDHSPNRADAMIWGISDLFPDLTRHEDLKPNPPQFVRRQPHWMTTL